MLSDEDLDNFVRDGFCVFDIHVAPELIEQAKALVWDFCPPSFASDDPATWSGVVEDSCQRQSMERRVGRLKFRECSRAFRSVRALTIWNDDIREQVKSLITPEASQKEAQRFMPIFRGLYPIFSQPADKCRIKAHCDTHFFQVGSVMYLNEVGTEDGAFVVWPGSHWLIAPFAPTLTHHHKPEGFDALCHEVERSITPVQVTGRAGTVILWHHRLLHGAGLNISGGVRHAVLCDFKNGLADSRMAGHAQEAFDETWSARVLAACNTASTC
jgi:hypothetical protein